MIYGFRRSSVYYLPALETKNQTEEEEGEAAFLGVGGDARLMMPWDLFSQMQGDPLETPLYRRRVWCFCEAKGVCRHTRVEIVYYGNGSVHWGVYVYVLIGICSDVLQLLRITL